MIYKKEIARRYDSSVEIYDVRYTDIQKLKYQEIFSRMDIRKSKLILDAGCGTGTLLGKIKESTEINSKLLGIDISFEMIKKAHQKYPDVDFLVADLDSLPLKDNSCTEVLSITVLQNLPEPEYSLKEISRVVSMTGQIAISILRKNWTNEKLIDLIEQTNLTIIDQWTAEVEDIGALCIKNP